MEVNDYLPLGKCNESLGIRVLSSNDNTPNPEILKFSNLMNQQLDINFNQNYFTTLNNENEKVKYILRLVCDKLKKVFPSVFNGLTDYIDILIPENMLSETGFISKMIKKIPEDYFKQVEIIGWLYQYYNQTEKDRVISAKKTYKKHEIAYATQLFTPEWIVRYMVENTLGKYWIEHSGDKTLLNKWKYINGEIEKKYNLVSPENITFIDPCCGSGHILVYAFDVLYDIYESCGYNKKDIANYILSKNLYGLDIDDRAGQLSVLSVLLKAREKDKDLFAKEIIGNLNVMSLQESMNIDESLYSNDLFTNSDISYLIKTFEHCKEIGSLIKTENHDYSNTLSKIGNNIFDLELARNLEPLVKQSYILSKTYNIVVTNPPYMNSSLMTSNLKNYVNKNYSNCKSDLFSAFIQRNLSSITEDGFAGYMTPYVWMFIAAYEELRKYILSNSNIDSLIQLEYSALEEATVPICTFVLSKNKDGLGSFYKLSDYKGGMQAQNEAYLNILNSKNKDYYKVNNEMFNYVPYNEIIYWLNDNALNNFKHNGINNYINPRIGLVTGDTNRFLRYWYEVPFNEIHFNCKNSSESISGNKKWFPYQKGGAYRKWYGNNEYIVNWYNDGDEIKNKNVEESTGRVRSHNYNGDFAFKKAITWTKISSSNYAFRYVNDGFLFDDAGPIGSCKEGYENLLLGLYNSKVGTYYLSMLNPTLNLTPGNLLTMPFPENITERKDEIDSIVDRLIE